ncbi:hypothetical protein AC1031_015031 [Aphanomyces cochlioides]|nr:hypothetical protein AC1031_015031 [Aphanomyces cochlioides]
MHPSAITIDSRSCPDSKFRSLEALVYSWYNVSSIDADCLANLTKPLHLTNPPFPPTTVANTMFDDIGNLDMEVVGGRRKTFMRYETDEGGYFLVKHMPDRVNPLSNQVEIIDKGRNYDLKGNLAKKELNKYPELKKRIEDSKRPLFSLWKFDESTSPDISPTDRANTMAAIAKITGDSFPAFSKIEPGIYGKDTPACISGSIRQTPLYKAFSLAMLGSSSVFLDIGSGAGQAKICASDFKPRLVLGLEVIMGRVATSIHVIMKANKDCLIYPVHAAAEEISYYDPATHVYCFMRGMAPEVVCNIKHGILRSSSVKYVITTNK